MRHEGIVLDLSESAQVKQILLSRPSRATRGFFVLLVLLLGAGFLWASLAKVEERVKAAGKVRPMTCREKVFAAVSGEEVAAIGSGRVVEVNFQEGDLVEKGQLLVKVDTRRIENDIARVQKTLEAAEAELGKLEKLRNDVASEIAASLEKAAASIAVAEKERDRAKEKHDRLQKLFSGGFVSAAEFREAHFALAEAAARLDRAWMERQEVERSWPSRREELEIRIVAKRGEILSARETLKNLELDLEQSEIRAAVGGIVTRGEVRVGDVLEASRSVLAIAPQSGFRISAAVPVADIDGVEVGMPARVKLDSYDYQKYGTIDGIVYSISPDTEETILPDGGTVVYYHVKIRLDRGWVGRGALRGSLKLGMSGQVEMVKSEESLLGYLVRQFKKKTRVS